MERAIYVPNWYSVLIYYNTVCLLFHNAISHKIDTLCLYDTPLHHVFMRIYVVLYCINDTLCLYDTQFVSTSLHLQELCQH